MYFTLSQSARVPRFRYELKEFLGRGSYGLVLSAVDNHTMEQVAIKKIYPDVLNNPFLGTRVVREIKLLAHFDHPNIIGIQNLLSASERSKVLVHALLSCAEASAGSPQNRSRVRCRNPRAEFRQPSQGSSSLFANAPSAREHAMLRLGPLSESIAADKRDVCPRVADVIRCPHDTTWHNARPLHFIEQNRHWNTVSLRAITKVAAPAQAFAALTLPFLMHRQQFFSELMATRASSLGAAFGGCICTQCKRSANFCVLLEVPPPIFKIFQHVPSTTAARGPDVAWIVLGAWGKDLRKDPSGLLCGLSFGTITGAQTNGPLRERVIMVL